VFNIIRESCRLPLPPFVLNFGLVPTIWNMQKVLQAILEGDKIADSALEPQDSAF
jgi:hypothetical protein